MVFSSMGALASDDIDSMAYLASDAVSFAATQDTLVVRLSDIGSAVSDVSVYDLGGGKIDFSPEDIVIDGGSAYINIDGKLDLDEVYRISVNGTDRYMRINTVFSDDASAADPTEIWNGLNAEYDSYENGVLVMTNPTDKGRELYITAKADTAVEGNQTLQYTACYGGNKYDMQAYTMSESINLYSGNNLFYNLNYAYANNIRVKYLSSPAEGNSGYYLIPINGGSLPKADVSYNYASVVSCGVLDIFRDGELVVNGGRDLAQMTSVPQSGIVGFRVVLYPDQIMRLSNIKVLHTELVSEEDIVMPPKAENVRISSSQTDDGIVLRGEYDFVYDGEQEDGTEYAWYYKTLDGTDWNPINGENARELVMDDNSPYKECIIKFEVMPNTAGGVNPIAADGKPKYRFPAQYAPQLPPTVSNLTISGNLVPGETVTANYDYYDYNGDSEKNSIITWYSSDLSDGDYAEIGSGKTYTLTENEFGKYIRFSVMPVAENPPYQGDKVFSNAAYVSTALNLEGMELLGSKAIITLADEISDQVQVYVNDETQQPTVDGKTLSVTVDSAADKNLVQIINGRKSCYINVTKQVLFKDDFDADINGWQGSVYHDAENGYLAINKNQSGKVYYDAADFSKSIQSNLEDYYVSYDIKSVTDDIRLFTDVLSDFGSNAYRVAVRKFASSNYPCGIYTASTNVTSYENFVNKAYPYFNYLQAAPWPCKVVIAANNSRQLLTVGGEVLYKDTMSNYSKGGLAFNTVGSNNDVLIDNLEVYKLDYKVTDTVPKVSNLRINGLYEVGSTINAVYDYSHEGGAAEGNTEFAWYVSDSEEGAYTLIDGANTNSFTISDEYDDKYLYCSVRPVSADGTFGSIANSITASKSVKPEVRNARITGSAIYGNAVKAEYDFYDANHDSKANESFKWFISDNGIDYTVIDGETANQLTVSESYAGKYIKAQITAEASVEPKLSDPADTEALYICYRPTAKNASITNIDNKILNASYEFVSKDQLEEGNTVIEWYVNGSLAGTGLSLDVSKISNASVLLKVTPYLKNPALSGETATASASISYGGSGSGSGSGGGGGRGSVSVAPGGGNISDVIKIDETKLPQKEYKFADMKGHWAYDAALYVTEHGIMSAGDKGNFFPELIVTRAEFVVYLCKALGISETAYAGTFGDVAQTDWYSGYIQAALDSGFISEDLAFNAYAPITREQACKIISIALNLDANNFDAQAQFDDYSSVSDWARQYVAAVCGAEIMKGTGNGLFEPTLTIDRGQLCTLIVNMLNNSKTEG